MIRFKKRLVACLTCTFVSGFIVARTACCEEPGAEAYARAVSGDSGLVAYWRLDADLKDAKGKADGKAVGGEPQFADGPGGGRALQLTHGRFVTLGNTPELDLRETTVELWFQPNFEPGAKYNPCIVAKREHGDHRQTRFSLHIQSDYSCLTVWNGETVTQYGLPEIRLKKEQWYHVALTCSAQEMNLYVDGVACDILSGGALFDFSKENLPLCLGSSSPRGQEQLECSIDEVAIYSRVLSGAEIASHVDAMGHREARLELAAAVEKRIEQEAKARAEADALRNACRDAILKSDDLPTTITGDYSK